MPCLIHAYFWLSILGIVYSGFIKFYGCRVVAVVGGFTWFFGFALSSLAPSVGFLYFSYGLIAGVYMLPFIDSM